MTDVPKEIKVADYIISPKEKISLSFKGDKPLSIVKQAEDILKKGTDVSSSAIFNEVLNYDATGGGFYSKLWAKYGFDTYTSSKYYVELQGSQDLETMKGKIDIKIYGKLETKIPYANSFQRALWKLYYNYFYKNHRNRYRIVAEKKIYGIKDAFMNACGIRPPE